MNGFYFPFPELYGNLILHFKSFTCNKKNSRTVAFLRPTHSGVQGQLLELGVTLGSTQGTKQCQGPNPSLLQAKHMH